MKLHEAVKKLMTQFGAQVACEARLANLVADVGGYETCPAMRLVFRDILKAGLGEGVYDAYCSDAATATSYTKALARATAKDLGYKQELVDYALDSLLYGLGLLADVSEPTAVGYDPVAKPTDILNDLDGQLALLRQKYSTLIDEVITRPADPLHDAPAYYSAEAQGKIYAIEAQIAALQQALGRTDTAWCRNKKQTLLFDLRKNQRETLLREVIKRYSPYNERLTDLFSHYPAATTAAIDTLEQEAATLQALQRTLEKLDPNWQGKGLSYKVTEAQRRANDTAQSALQTLQPLYLELLKKSVETTTPVHNPEDKGGTGEATQSSYPLCQYSEQSRDSRELMERYIKFAYQNSALDYDDWCEKQAQALLAEKQKNVAAEALNDLKRHYVELLDQLIVQPRVCFIKRSGYYSDEAQRTLEAVEDQIKHIYAISGEAYDDWCEGEMRKALARYSVGQGNLLLQFALKIFLPAAVTLCGVLFVVSYVSSADARERFEATIAQGKQQAAATHYAEAIRFYAEAKNGYDASFRVGHYRDIADEHIAESFNKATTACEGHITDGHLAEAHELLQSLPADLLPDYQQQLVALQTKLNDAVAQGLNQLIDNISANKGHLDNAARAKLDELLRVSPDDYWLNLIKKKEQ